MKNFRLTTLLLAIIAFQLNASAQTWQWGKRIGSNYVTGEFSDKENISDICSDKKGNIYIAGLSRTSSSISADTHSVSSAFSSFANNIVVSSYNCEGLHRWSKVIGTPSGAYCKSIQTDTLGGVYLLTDIAMQSDAFGYIGSEAALTGSNSQLYIIRLDSSGSLDWVVNPISDTISFSNAINHTYPIDMHVTKGGEVSVMSLLPSGAHEDGQLILQQPDVYMLRYTAQGQYIDGHKMPIRAFNNATYRMSMHMTRSANNNYVVSAYVYYPDYDSVRVGTEYIDHSFIASFSPGAQLNWLHEFGIRPELESIFYNPQFTSRPHTDAQNHIYTSGTCSHSDTLAGHAFVNTINQNITSMPFVAKLNADGSLVWTQNASVEYPANAWGIAMHNDSIALCGAYPGTLKWENSTSQLQQVANEGRDPYVAVFNTTTGTLISLDSLSGNVGFDEIATSLCSDGNGSFYVGGNFGTYLIVANDGLQAVGDNDYFIAKYGSSNCSFVLPNAVEAINKMDLQIWPNPSNGTFHIRIPQYTELLEVYDMSGKRVFVQKGISNTQTMDVTLETAGLYLLRLTTKDVVITKRLVKSND